MDYYDILLAKKLNGGGGGEATLIDKSISSNGTYNASSDNADGYKKVVVNVPNPSTGTVNITQNGTVDVTNYASADVNVPVGFTVQELASQTKPSGVLDVTGCTLSNYCFAYRSAITRVEGVLAENSGSGFSAFMGCSGLTSVNIHFGTPNQSTFQSCSNLKTAVLVGDITKESSTNIFNSCTNLEKADLTIREIKNNVFYNCYKLDTLILRKPTIVSLAYALTNCSFANGKEGGTIYIPKTLYDHLGDGTSDDYQSATNWSTVYGYGTITWAKIEGSIYETQYADGTTIGA